MLMLMFFFVLEMRKAYLPAFWDCVSIKLYVLDCFPERTEDWRENPHALPRNLPGVVHLLRVFIRECFIGLSFAAHDIIVFWKNEK